MHPKDIDRKTDSTDPDQSSLDRVKRIWYVSHMRAAKVQASLRIRAVSPEPPLLAHTSNESRGTFRQKARSLAPLNGTACAVKICHDGMLEDTNSLDRAQSDVGLHCLSGPACHYDTIIKPRHETTCLCHMQTTKAQTVCTSTQSDHSDQQLCCSLPT